MLTSRTITEKVAFLTGLVGAILGSVVWGFYHWGGNLLWGLIPLGSDKPNYGTVLSISDTQSEMLIYYIFLFVPACLAFTSVLFSKKYLMYLAIFLHLPIGDYIGGMPTGLGSFTTIQIVWFLYVLSAVLMTVKIKTKNNLNMGVDIDTSK
jgi:hypothetical protein